VWEDVILDYVYKPLFLNFIMKKINLLIILIIVLSFIFAGYAYTHIQETSVASHWDSNGNVNGYMPKFIGLFLLPLIALAVYLLFLLLPKIDPLKKNIQKFRRHYDGFILVIIVFFVYVFTLSILFNLGYDIKIDKMLFPAIGLLFIYLGFIMKKLKRNWFIGIRTPWTLSNDKVWEKTHNLGSILFVISGLIIISGLFFNRHLIWLVLIPILISVTILVVYSYIVFKQTENNKLEKKR